MKKVIFSIIGTILIAVFYNIALPFAVMEAQNVVVDQMKNTDAATAAVHYVGNGTGLLGTVCLVIWLALMASIWYKTIAKHIKDEDKQ